RVECGGKHITDAIAQKLDLSSERAEDIKVRHGLEIGPVSDIGDGDESDISRVIFDVARESLERIAREIEKSLGYCAANRRGLRVQKLLLAGGGSMMKNVDKFFADRLGIATEVGNPFKGIELGANPIAHRLARQAPLYTVAVGLAKLEAPGNGTH
nr:pilus assembly protein PilM [PVC group bacterium]